MGVSVVSVALAFLLATHWMTKSYSQTAPADPSAAPANSQLEPPPTAAEVAAEVQGFLEPYIYDAKNRRDPFQPYQEFKEIEQGAVLSPLQKFELDQLKLVGILWDVRNPRAMFVDPNNEVHIAGRDEGIGKRNGYIATIRESEVVVVETYHQNGQNVFKTRVLRLDR
jgi:type IV pilus assembly protein PilP